MKTDSPPPCRGPQGDDDVAVWCGKPGQGHVRSQADRGCAFWEREPGADDDLPTPEPPAQASELSEA